jgi:hypothetical protein
LEKILEVLKPLELRGKELSKAKATLLTSDGGFKFMFQKLRTLDTDPSQEILVALKQRVSERRNKDIISLMKYLKGSNIPRDESYEDFSYSTKPAAILLAKDLIKRLFSSPHTATIPNFLESTPTTSSLAMVLQSSIESVSSVRPTTRPDTFTKLFGKKNLNFLMQLVLGHQNSRNCCRHFSQFSQLQRVDNSIVFIIKVYLLCFFENYSN